MTIKVLVDNNASDNFRGEHGLSLFIEGCGQNILFDTGSSDLFYKNLKKFGHSKKDVDCVVLSHGHWDHANGLEHILHKKLVCHPSVFRNAYRKKDEAYVGMKYDFEYLNSNFDLTLSHHAVQLTKACWFLGEIPRINDFETGNTPFIDENGDDDFVPDDTGLALLSGDGLVVISGCGHSGIINMVEQARKVSGINSVHAVLGGFHLKDVNEQTFATIQAFKQLQVEKIMPMHCNSEEVKVTLANELNCEFYQTGSEIVI